MRKALGHGLKTICVVNKIDRDTARPEWVHDKVLELFLELGADEDQFNAPFLYGSAKLGFADRTLNGPRKDMNDLFETVIERVSPPVIEDAPFKMLVSNIDWDEYVGRMAIGRILSGEVQQGDQVNVLRRDGSRLKAKIIKLKQFAGLQTNDVTSATAGDIAGLAGFEVKQARLERKNNYWCFSTQF